MCRGTVLVTSTVSIYIVPEAASHGECESGGGRVPQLPV